MAGQNTKTDSDIDEPQLNPQDASDGTYNLNLVWNRIGYLFSEANVPAILQFAASQPAGGPRFAFLLPFLLSAAGDEFIVDNGSAGFTASTVGGQWDSINSGYDGSALVAKTDGLITVPRGPPPA